MLLQRYKIQLENYQNKKNSILKQLAPIDAELAEIDSNINMEAAARNQSWRELFKKNRQLALPNPVPITNFKSEIAKCKTEIDTMSSDLTSKTLQIEGLRREILAHHANGQDAINTEVAIHIEEKNRITSKLTDINNMFVSNLVELLEAKSANQQVLINTNTALCNTEMDILNCKNMERQNRCIVMDILRSGRASCRERV